MNAEVKTKWCNALRSGEYKQATGELRVKDSFCCLGVLCDLYEKEHPNKLQWDEVDHLFRFINNFNAPSSESTHLPPNVRDWAGLNYDNPQFSQQYFKDKEKVCSTLIEANDEVGLNFNEIADLIEKEL